MVEHAGSIELNDRMMEQARIFVHALGQSESGAWRLAYQIRDVILPPADGPWGIHRAVEYEDEEGNLRALNFSGARLESGPRAAPENATRVITNYLINYY